MKHRAKAIGAILEIKSSIGKGTVVKLIFSLKSIK
jgi:signal transduction histidine kinase